MIIEKISPALIARMESRLKALGLSDRAASMDATGKPDIVRVIRSGTMPITHRMNSLAKVLGVSVEWLLNGTESADPPSAIIALNSAPTLPSLNEMPADIPVMGTVAGSLGEGAFLLESGEIDYVRRPRALAKTKDIYAFYVVGDSMEHRFFEGDLIYVSERRPVRIGDYVVVQVQNGENDCTQAYLKRLIKRCPKILVLEQHNISAIIDIPMKNVISIHRILTINDLYGV